MEPITNPIIFDEFFNPACDWAAFKHLKSEPKSKGRKKLEPDHRRRCPFYMVDGIEIEKQMSTPINTNSGVLTEEDFKKLS